MTAERRPNSLENVVLQKHNKTVPEKMAAREVEYREENEIVSGEVALTTYPFLPERSIRYSDMGEMFIQSFRNSIRGKTLTINDKLTPNDRKVMVRYTPVATLEKGIHMADEIANSYDKKNGKESQSVTTYIKIFRELSLAFQDLSIGEEEFKVLAEETLAKAEETGFGTARLEWKNRVFEGILKSFQKDRLQRRNRGASRMRAVHLYPLTTEARLINEKTHNKYRSIAFKLHEERGRERDVFLDVIDSVDALLEMGDIKFSENRRTLLEYAFKNLSNHSIKFAPYSGAAAKARFLLLGKEGQHEGLVKYLGKEEAEEYKDRKEFRKMGQRDQKTRLHEVRTILDLTLLEGDRNLNTRSSDWAWGEEN